jgi:uncharacterized protein
MEIIFAFFVFVLFFLGMSIGFLVKGKPIKGSCGGVAALMGNESCEICGGDPNKCDEVQQVKNNNDLAYDASVRKK